MKLLVAIIRPERLEAVQQALGEVDVFRLTVMDALGLPEPPPGADDAAAAKPKPLPASRLEPLVRLEVALNEPFVEPATSAIARAARTGRGGDGKIFVLPLEDVVRIRTGERGVEAL